MAQISLTDQVARDAAPLVGTDLIVGLRMTPDQNYQPVVEQVSQFLSGIHTTVPNFPDSFQDASLFFRESDQNLILSYLHRGTPQTIETHINIPRGTGGTTGQTAMQVQAAIAAGIAAGVANWAKAGNTDTIPFVKIDLTELENWIDHHDILPKDQETLVTSREELFGHSASQTLDLDTDKTVPTAGISHWNIQGHIVQVDNAALHALQPGTVSQNLLDAPGTYLTIPNAISSQRDGNFDIPLYVAYSDLSNTRYLIQIGGNTRLDRQLEVTSTEDISFLTDLEFNATTNVVSAPKRTGTAESTETFTLPAYISGIAYNDGTHVITITHRDGANSTQTTIQLPSVTTPQAHDPPTVYYDHTITVSASNRNTWIADPGANAYDASSDGVLDLYVGDDDVDDITPIEFGNLDTVAVGARTSGGTLITDTGYFAKNAANEFLFAPLNTVAIGTTLRIRMVGKPIQYVRTTALDDLIGAFLSRHAGITYSTSTKQVTYQWAETDLAADVQTKLNRPAVGVESWAQTANANERIPSAKLPTTIPAAQLPFINWRAASTPADLADRTAVGSVGYEITADLVFNDIQYKAGEQVVKTNQGQFYRIVKVTQEDVPDIESDVTQYKLIAVAESPRRDIIYQPAQAGTTLTAQWRGGPGLGAIANTQGRTANDINAEILEWYYADSGRIFHLYTRQPGQGGTAWDTLYINGTAYSLTAAGVNQGTATPPHGSATGTTGIFYRFALPSNPVIGGMLSLNLEDNEASPGDRFFVGNPRQEQRLVAQATSIQHGMRFPTSPVNDELFLLPTDGAPGTYTDEDGNEQTSALSGDIFQYSHTTARWTRIYTNQHRPIPSATVGNTDPFPVGASGKVAFERAPQTGLPASNTRRANSIILDWTGKPYVNLSEGQKALAFDDQVLHIGEADFPADQELAPGHTEFRFQGLDHVTPVRLDQTITFNAWTLRDWRGGQPGQTVFNESRVRSSTILEPLASITYYSQWYYQAGLRGRYVIRYHGNAGNNFDPTHIALYLRSSTNPRGDEQELDLVKEGNYWKTAIQVPDQFRPETGTGASVATRTRNGNNAIRYNLKNGNGNYEFLTTESIDPRYVRSNSDIFQQMRRQSQIWEANATEIALIHNDADQRWNNVHQNPNSWIHVNDIPDSLLFFEFEISGAGFETGLLSTQTFSGKTFKGLYRIGDRRQGRTQLRGFSDDYGLNTRVWRELTGGAAPNYAANSELSCVRFTVPGLIIIWAGISNNDGRLTVGTDHVSRWGTGTKLRLIQA